MFYHSTPLTWSIFQNWHYVSAKLKSDDYTIASEISSFTKVHLLKLLFSMAKTLFGKNF